VSYDMRKSLAVRELAKALEMMDLSEIEALAKRYGVDITSALDGEYFTKADESLPAIARRIGSHPLIDAANKLDALTKRADAQDDFIKRAFAMFDEVADLNKRRAEDTAFAAEFKRTGKTPATLFRRFAKEGSAL
jgi:hypothetical protein